MAVGGSRATRHIPALALVAVVLAAASCGTSLTPEPTVAPTPLPSIPGPSVRQPVGAIAGEEVVGRTTMYHLADGRDVTVDPSRTRLIIDSGGSPAILVTGRDAQGDWAAVIGHQDGTPPECFILRDQGFELGDSVVVDGVRWPKSAAFEGGGPAPGYAFPYPDGTRFCLDDQGRVTQPIGP